MTASPPTIAKSIPSAARADNNFSNREVISLGFGKGSMRVFFEKTGQIFQMRQPPGHRGRTSNHLPHWLLHWLNRGFHPANLIPPTADGQHQAAGISPCRGFAEGWNQSWCPLHVAANLTTKPRRNEDFYFVAS